MKAVLKILGVSSGDMKAVEAAGSTPSYVIGAAARSFLRLLANHCLIPSLRVRLFRASGIRIGRRVQLNMNLNFLDDFIPGRIILEDEVSVAPLVSFIASSHPNNSPLYREFGLGASGTIRIRSGAWLGVGAVVMPGVTVGRCAVVGANAVVTRNVDDFAIMAGVPAEKIGDVR
ncbi:MAG: acyltransferase [Pseudomonadota bacterium]